MVEGKGEFMVPLIILGVMWVVCLFCIINPQALTALTVKYFKFLGNMFGLDIDATSTPKAVLIVRCWNIFILLVISWMIYMVLTGKVR